MAEGKDNVAAVLEAEQRIVPRKRGRALRIGIFGGFGIGNFGNDASLEAVMNFLRAEHPRALLSAICTNPTEVTARFGLPAIPTQRRPKGIWRKIDTRLLRQPSAWASWIDCLRALGKYDVVIVAGTGVFDDFRDSPLGWPSRLLRWSLAARLRGVRLAYVSVGGGPILNPVSRVLMKRAAQLAHHRSYRDAFSRNYMQSIGLNESRSQVLPDLAFLLPAQPAPPRAGRLTIGVGLMNYRGWRDSDDIYQSYIDTHVELIRWIEAQGHGVRILIGQTPADLVAVRDVEVKLDRTLMDDRQKEMTSFHDAMSAIAETDVVVASRYHVQIAALKMRRPLISLSYAPKNDALLADVGMGAFCQDVHDIDFEMLTQQIATLAAERARYEALLEERVSAMEQRLRDALLKLDVLEA